jgi:hypothetical protein
MKSEKKETRGGSRQGSGAKQKYGEKTVLISPFWCPESKVPEIKELIHEKLSEYKNHAQVIEQYFKTGDKSEIERLGIKFTKPL